MPVLRHSITIERPVHVVFDYVTDLDNFAEWQSGTTDVALTSASRVAVGTRWHVTGRVMGRALTIGLEVTEYVPNRRLSFRTTSGPLDGASTLTFESVDAGTRVSLDGSAKLTGALRMFESVAGQQAQLKWEADMARLKAILESQVAEEEEE